MLSLWKLCTGKCNQRQEMSTSLLPPLTLTVGKAPVHVYRKGQKAPTTSQQAVLTLLKRRHERYLAAHKGLDAATRIHLTAADTDTLTIRSVDHGSTCIHTLSQQVCRNANLLNDLGKHKVCIKLITRNVSFFTCTTQATTPPNKLMSRFFPKGCSALAEHVVHRAKVRLKRRRNERRVCALRNRATHDPAGPGSRQLVCVKSDLLAVANPLCRGKPKSAETFAVHVKQACKRRKQEIELKLPPLTCNGQREGSVNRSAVSVETSLTCYSSCPASQRGSARNAKGRSVFGCSQLMEEPSEHVRVQPGRQRVVYFSEKQSETPRSTGVPSAPPATPATG